MVPFLHAELEFTNLPEKFYISSVVVTFGLLSAHEAARTSRIVLEGYHEGQDAIPIFSGDILVEVISLRKS